MTLSRAQQLLCLVLFAPLSVCFFSSFFFFPRVFPLSASFQVGYNSGVLNVPQSTIVASLHLTTLQWSIAVAIFCIGGLLGSMSGGKAADHIGRKNFLIANNVAFIAGGLCESLAGGIALLSLGRLAIGIGCGGATVVVPMYLGEIAPANLRGSLGTMNQFAMVIGILVATC